MIILKNSLKYALLAALLILPGFFTPKTQAFEPVTMALLAPVALKVYEAAEPRMVKGALFGGRKLVQMGGNVLELLYLPLGVVQVTLGMPFGFFADGTRNIGKGLIAPGKLMLNAIALPFSFMGVDI